MGQVSTPFRLTREKLRPYQAREIERLAAGESRALFWQPGAGKTAVVLQAIAAQFAAGLARRVLIISTPTVVSTVWEAEIDNWHETVGMAYFLLRGVPKRRTNIFEAYKSHPGPAVAAIGFDSANTLEEGFAFDVLVIDEASLARNPASGRFRALIELAGRARQRIVLTGSPAPNSATDVFGPVALVDLGAALGTRFSAFRDAHTVKTGPRSWHRRDLPNAREKITDKIRHLSTSLTTADVTDIPPLQRVIVPVDIGQRATEIYQALENEAVNLLTAGKIKPDAFLIKAQQVANGFLYTDDGAHRIHDAKIEAAADIVEPILSARGQVILVYQFKADLEVLRSRWPKLAVLGSSDSSAKPEDIVRAWNTGQIDVLALNPRAAGHGINLQKNARCADILWLSATWSSELYEQTNARIHRPGQVNHVRVHLIVARETIDQAVVGVLDRKVDAQSVLMALLKERSAASNPETTVFAARLREARLAAARVHPDAGGSAEAFRIAWSRYQALAGKA